MVDIREERGKAIADQGDQIKKVNDHSFKVRSQSGNRVYEVKNTVNGMTCTCPDFVYRGGKCKHIMATRYYLEVEKDTPKGTVTEKVHLTYAQAWNAYNEAQKVEVKLFDELLKDLVKAIPEPEQTTGRPHLPLQENLFCAIQKVYSQLSSRRAYSLFQNATDKGQIKHAPHFNSTSELFNKPETTEVLHKLVMLSASVNTSTDTSVLRNLMCIDALPDPGGILLVQPTRRMCGSPSRSFFVNSSRNAMGSSTMFISPTRVESDLPPYQSPLDFVSVGYHRLTSSNDQSSSLK